MLSVVGTWQQWFGRRVQGGTGTHVPSVEVPSVISRQSTPPPWRSSKKLLLALEHHVALRRAPPPLLRGLHAQHPVAFDTIAPATQQRPAAPRESPRYCSRDAAAPPTAVHRRALRGLRHPAVVASTQHPVSRHRSAHGRHHRSVVLAQRDVSHRALV